MRAVSKLTKFAIAKGRVQGVGFRYTARALADTMGLIGYAKNLTDGTVEIVVSGQTSIVDLFFQRLKEEFRAEIDVQPGSIENLPNRFEVK